MGMGNEMHKTPQMAQAGFKSNKKGTLVIFSHNSNKNASKFFSFFGSGLRKFALDPVVEFF
jgi:hypothetical protein